MGNYDFKKDILVGEDGEKVIADDLVSMGGKILCYNKTNSHDIRVEFNREIIDYECKTDVFRDTGNLFVETSCRGKDSGINVSKAKWFATYFKCINQIWYIETLKLKELIKNFNHREVKNCGDSNSNTKGVLIKRSLYRNNFIVRSIKNNL